MAGRWTVLASGSGGNASVLETDAGGILLDAGLGPRQLDSRLKQAGASLNGLRAVILTHTHADHWSDRTLYRLAQRGVTLYCHSEHRRELQLRCPSFQAMQFAGLVTDYDDGRPFVPCDGIVCRAVAIAHDGGPTFALRLDGAAAGGGAPWAVGYAADLGSWDRALVRALADTDVLALEFNHDVTMQQNSGRDPWLIARVLGDHGHLSNEQGADLLQACLAASQPGRIRQVVQLHLSRQCNRPSLAIAAARDVLNRTGRPIELHTAQQDLPTRTLVLGETPLAGVA